MLGLFKHKFYYCFHMTEIVIRYQPLKAVVACVWTPKVSLMLTFVLFWMLVYLWALWGYRSFPVEYSGLGITKMYEYFLYLYDKTFKYDGAVGGFFEDDNPATGRNSLERFLYDGIYNFACVSLIFEIVLGIIIDTFRKLREMQASKEGDIADKCFMCGKLRHEFDKLPEERNRFPSHVKNQHNQWYYVYYLGYLLDKDSTEYTGNEQYIGELYLKNEVNWLPQGKAMCLQRDDEFDEVQIYAKIKSNLAETKKNLKSTRTFIEKLDGDIVK